MLATAPQQVSTPSTKKSHTLRNVGILVIVVLFLIVFFYVPMVPYTFGSYSDYGTSVTATGTVSMSYAL
jgi:ABC-type transporter Mla subunit MlaD